jgi:hypothetical protein
VNRTCIVSSIRLTVVLGHGDPDFTWSYVPLGAYSVFEPLGGILCTNLPIIWHMWRKRNSQPLLPGSSAFKSPKSSGASPGSGESRRSRMARSLGLSNHDPTENDSQSRTILGEEEAGNTWVPGSPGEAEVMKDGVVVAQPRPAQFWNKVERGPSHSSGEMTEAGSSNGGIIVNSEVLMDTTEGAKKSSWAKGLKSSNGMKKTTWEVRRKS